MKHFFQKIGLIVCLCLLNLLPLLSVAAESQTPLLKAHIDPNDQASLQRGAKWFMNYCSGCHSLGYLRYNQMAKDLGVVNDQGDVLPQLVKDNFIFTGASLSDVIQSAMQSSDAIQWFGVAPPDLTSAVSVRSVDWIYTYLMSFYEDTSRPFGANNALFPDVAMPNVLLNLQGTQIAVYQNKKRVVDGKEIVVPMISHLVLAKPGLMSPVQFEQMVNDLVNFLAYTADPMRGKREFIGIFVIGFLIIFAVFAYLLKRAYWRDVK